MKWCTLVSQLAERLMVCHKRVLLPKVLSVIKLRAFVTKVSKSLLHWVSMYLQVNAVMEGTLGKVANTWLPVRACHSTFIETHTDIPYPLNNSRILKYMMGVI